MRYKLLGRSGLRVSELALGAMTFGEEWGWGASREESRRMLDAYAEAGGNFMYSLFMRPEDPNFAGNHRKNMVGSLEASLRRLGMDYMTCFGCPPGSFPGRTRWPWG